MKDTQIKAVSFDLDGTLAESKSILSERIAELLCQLLVSKKVLVMSGGSFEQFEKQFLSKLSQSTLLDNLYLMPTSGSKFYAWNKTEKKWEKIYSYGFSELEKEKIISSFNEALDEVGIKEDTIYGDLIEDRESQITFSALGQEAPIKEKIKWDPDQVKRKIIVAALLPKLPEFNIRIGGTTTIDITKKGIDKAFGLYKFMEYTSLDKTEIVFVGDALFDGGNDAVVKKTGIVTIPTSGVKETEEIIKNLL